jgi:ATP-dependent DNA ligase
MKRLKGVASKLKALAAISGKNDKKDFIIQYKEDKDFLAFLKYRLNPLYSYKIKKFDEYRMLEPLTTYEDIVNILEVLRTSDINQKIKQQVVLSLQHTDHEIVEIIEGIITKSYSIGVDTSVNKALGYELIPEFKCMLASPLPDPYKVKPPYIVDLKMDGVRCISRIKDGICIMYTRQGRLMHFPLLEKQLLQLANGEDLTFDGEIVSDNRTDISGICNSNLKTGYKEGSDIGIYYSLFDVMPTAIFDSKGTTNKQEERTLELAKRFLNGKFANLKLTPSHKVSTMKEVYNLSSKYIAAGEEGVIVKDIRAPYAFKRSKAWCKIKQVNSTSLKVVGVVPGTGKRKGKIGSLICESSDGLLSVNVGSGLTDSDVEMKPPIGKIVEVIFNVLIKGDGSDTYSLFLPRFVSGDFIRVDKDEADSLAKIKAEHIGAMQI